MPRRSEPEARPSEQPGSPLYRAQDLCWDAFDSPSRKQRIELAKRALELSPDCADAYVILAYEERAVKRSLDLYAKGVEAGERALGPATFTSQRGHFWGILETRPYMRARFGLARSLWKIKRQDEAIAHFSDMLQLNPSDNQGVRYLLARYLLEVGRDSDAEDILKFYEEDCSAEWNYTRLLIRFRKDGDSDAARDLLWVAIKTNYHVPSFLIGERPLPARLPDRFRLGFIDEAMCYAADNATVWRKTPGALLWLARELRWDF
jgi:tetratricopeptide (TPR) repeat protein